MVSLEILSKIWVVLPGNFLGDAAPGPFWKPSPMLYLLHRTMPCSILQGRQQTWGTVPSWASAHPLSAFPPHSLQQWLPKVTRLDPVSAGRRADHVALPDFFRVFLKSQWLWSKQEMKRPVAAQQECRCLGASGRRCTGDPKTALHQCLLPHFLFNIAAGFKSGI